MKTRTILYADSGNVLTDGETYGTVVYLAEGAVPEDFREITKAEYEEIMEEKENGNQSGQGVP